MDNTLLLVPDFLLILIGFVLCRYTALDRGLWDGVERLVYYVLFPVLLFNSIVKAPLEPMLRWLIRATAFRSVAKRIVAEESMQEDWRNPP